jgi:orotate phosphoribosyltransferase
VWSNHIVEKLLEKSGAIKDGHFLLASGAHSNKYVQCSYLTRYPWINEEIIRILAKTLSHIECDIILSPAIGGIIFGYTLASKLGKIFLYAERVNGKMQLRRDFYIPSGKKVLIMEDVITTGGSSQEVAEIVLQANAIVCAYACVVLRAEETIKLTPLFYLVKLALPKYNPSECPLCKTNIPLQTPGIKQLGQSIY